MKSDSPPSQMAVLPPHSSNERNVIHSSNSPNPKKLEKRQTEDELKNLRSEFPTLTLEEVQKTLQKFSQYDHDNDGVLNREEFYELQKEMAPHVSEPSLIKELADFHFDKIDKDHSGGIDKSELLSSFKDIFGNERKELAQLLKRDFPAMKLEEIEKILAAFEKFDLDHNGCK